jgi:hypothetical protein
MHSQTAEESERQAACSLKGAFLREHAAPFAAGRLSTVSSRFIFPPHQLTVSSAQPWPPVAMEWIQKNLFGGHGRAMLTVPASPSLRHADFDPVGGALTNTPLSAGQPVFPIAAARRRSALASPAGVAARPVPAHDWPDEECVPTAKIRKRLWLTTCGRLLWRIASVQPM